MNHITIILTTDLVEDFEHELGFHLDSRDHLEIFNQLFQILDKHSPMDLTDRNVLTYDSLLFANHLKVDRIAVDHIAYRMMVQLWQRLHYHNFYVNNALMYFPFSMNGKDLCVRRYNS